MPFIREVAEQDLEDIKEIETACFPAPWDPEIFDILARWEGTIPLKDGRILHMKVLENDGQLCGYAVWEEIKEGAEGHLMNIAISEEKRQQGYGKMLLEHVFKSLRIGGLNECWLEVREGNKEARSLYESMGMSANDRIPKYYDGEDAIIYRIKL
jgi:ribosomal-protein-alanine N-acetyltransferase